jgi:hypothetical protein
MSVIFPTFATQSALMFTQVSPTQVDAIFPVRPGHWDDPYYPNFNLPFVYPKTKYPDGMPRYLSMKDSREIQWYYKYQPYLAFIPKDDVFQGPIFGRLQGSRSTFEANVVPHTLLQFVFHPAVTESWLRLENALLYLISSFYVRLSPMTAPRPPLPSDTRFFDPKPSIKNVVDSVMFAQKCFLYLIADLRYSIAKCTQIHCIEGVMSYTKIFGISDLDPIWMKDLAASKAMLSDNLAGCVVHCKDLEDGFDIHRFAEGFAPVYIPFASITRAVFHDADKDILTYAPDKYDFAPLIDQNVLDKLLLPFRMKDVGQRIKYEWFNRHLDVLLDVPFVQTCQPVYQCKPLSPPPPSDLESLGCQSDLESLECPPPSDIESPSSPIGDLPDPLPGSNQYSGEWWYHHYRHVNACIEFEDVDDDDELSAYQARGILLNKCNALPTICLDEFYVWEPAPSHPDYLLRRPLDISEARSLWATYPPTHRVHNVLKEEWDLYHVSCNFTTMSRDPTISDEPLNLPNLTEASATKSRHHYGIRDDRKLMLDTQLQAFKDKRRPIFCEREPLENARRRFGFLFPNPPVVNDASLSKGMPWWFYLGHSDCLLQPAIEIQVCETLWLLQKGHHDQLVPLLDILSQADALIARNDVRITHFPAAVFEYSEQHPKNLYLLDFPEESHADWFIGVTQATDVVLALREGWAKDSHTLVKNFLQHGIRFYTLSAVPDRVPTGDITLQRFDLPPAPVHHGYTMTDFYEYEQRREELFDSPYGRIAGRSGGIVARLWRRDQSKFEQRVQEVMVGPTAAALWKGVRVKLGERWFYDDELTRQMDAYICGQYEPEKSECTTESLV